MINGDPDPIVNGGDPMINGGAWSYMINGGGPIS